MESQYSFKLPHKTGSQKSVKSVRGRDLFCSIVWGNQAVFSWEDSRTSNLPTTFQAPCGLLGDREASCWQTFASIFSDHKLPPMSLSWARCERQCGVWKHPALVQESCQALELLFRGNSSLLTVVLQKSFPPTKQSSEDDEGLIPKPSDAV